jgi:hypothetical protein
MSQTRQLKRPKRVRTRSDVVRILDTRTPEEHRYLAWGPFQVGQMVEFSSEDPGRPWKTGRIESMWSSCQTRKRGVAMRLEVGRGVWIIRLSDTCRVPAVEPATSSSGRKRLATSAR